MNKKNGICTQINKKISLKMLVGFKKNCDRLKIYIKITFNFKREIPRKMLVGVKRWKSTSKLHYNILKKITKKPHFSHESSVNLSQNFLIP